MVRKTTTVGKSKIDLSGKKKHRKTKAYMRSIPWKYDFKNNCVKCNRAYHLQRHHITYDPPLTVFLCKKCHEEITMLNTAGAAVAGTNLKTKTIYTNKIRVIIWRWFLENKLDKKKHPNILVKEILTSHQTLAAVRREADIELKRTARYYTDKWLATNKARLLKDSRALLESNSTKHPFSVELSTSPGDLLRGVSGKLAPGRAPSGPT